MSYRFSRRPFAALLLAALAACGDATRPVVVASVAVTPPAHTLVVGQQVTLSAFPKAPNGEILERQVSWESEDVSRATVTATGVVTALAAGEVGILAITEGKAGRAVITIQPPPPVPVAEVRLSADNEIVLAWDGDTVITAVALDSLGNVLEGRPVSWQTNRPNVAAINDGHIYAIRPGTAFITAIIEGKVAQVGVKVEEPPIVALQVVPLTTGLEVGDNMPFSAKITRANGETVYGPAEWTSSNPAVLKIETVDLMYTAVAALAEGEATLAIAKEGMMASLALKVTKRPAFDLIYNKWEDTSSYIMRLGLLADGLVPVKLNAGSVSREPSPSPDGTQFVFAVSQQLLGGGTQNDLYIVNTNGMNMRWLTRISGTEHQPEWSPDGTKILYRQVLAGGHIDLFTIDPDGTNVTNLTANLPVTFVDKGQASWSPDGSKIAFIGSRDGQHKVWVMNADGSGLTQITTDAGYDEYPAFSPDGTKIAFNRYNTATPAFGNDIMIVPAQGGTPMRLALPGHQVNPAWSPDGALIAVNGTATLAEQVHDIFTLRPDGSGYRRRTVDPAFGGGYNPAWIKR